MGEKYGIIIGIVSLALYWIIQYVMVKSANEGKKVLFYIMLIPAAILIVLLLLFLRYGFE